MLGCKMRNWWILKYSCPKHNLKNNIPRVEVVVEPIPINELEMVEINLQDNNNNDNPDQDGTRPIDVINPPSHPQNNTSENVQDETNEDGIQDVKMLIRTNKNGTLKNKNYLIKLFN